MGPDGSNRLDDGDHLKGSSERQKYFFDATGGMYTEVSAIYREIFEEMMSVVEKNSGLDKKDRFCPEESFGKIMDLLKQAEAVYRNIYGCDAEAEHDFDPDRLKVFSDPIWRLVKFQNKPFYVKRSNEYIIIFKKTSNNYRKCPSFEVKSKMESLKFDEFIEKVGNDDIPVYKKQVANEELDGIMKELGEMYCKKDTLSVKGIF